MSASADTYGDQTEWEKPGHENYFCACFMLLAPSEVLFNYYLYVLAGGDALKNAAYPEQDLLIWVHRENGQMPWRRIPIEWSANDGEMNDEIEGGVKSLHVKAWEGAMQTKEVGNAANEKTRKMWRELIKEMEEYYRLGSLT
ncbi:glycosyltransferase family 8 protein [Zopfia rhizophila CBS 207.26]|uniref:Glycosyltransferase family 8 protein n=1 Tax=Zopfia rhizophila CBS 207.26 TaxID=1314779 RepID=A0A6A6EV82_9PEZI|nr:glycosyltransferase family 8 protein [Zopfia rhizophila CBS 207.26]